MLIIGERINSTRKRIGEAVRKRDADFIREEARKQVAAGAHMLDVNGGIPGREAEYLQWLVSVVQEAAEVPLCLDSADAGVLGQALPMCRKQPMINSITYESQRLESLVPLAREHRAQVIALCMSESGPPSGIDGRVETASRLVDRLTSERIPIGDIYVDPCVFPLSTGTEHGPALLDAIARIRERGPERKLVGLTVEEGVPRHGYPVLHGEVEVGKVASGTYSPTLGHGIATAYLPAALAEPGTMLSVGIRRKVVPAQVVRPPFVKATSLAHA